MLSPDAPDFNAKMRTKIDFGWGSAPGPGAGAYSAPHRGVARGGPGGLGPLESKEKKLSVSRRSTKYGLCTFENV